MLGCPAGSVPLCPERTVLQDGAHAGVCPTQPPWGDGGLERTSDCPASWYTAEVSYWFPCSFLACMRKYRGSFPSLPPPWAALILHLG